MSSERRRDLRFAYDVQAQVERKEGGCLAAQTIDLSYSGICVDVEEPVAIVTLVHVHLQLHLKGSASEAIIIPSKIVWSTPVEGRNQLGARFDPNMDKRVWGRLDTLLQFLAGDLVILPPTRE